MEISKLKGKSAAMAESPSETNTEDTCSYYLVLDEPNSAVRAQHVSEVRDFLAQRGIAARLQAVPQMAQTDAEARALLRGEQRLVQWIDEGVLVDVSVLEQAWGMTRQGIDAARRRGELFSLWIRNQHWYPRVFLEFQRGELAQISRALGAADPTDKLLFLLREHGALGGRSPAKAVSQRHLDDVLRIAAAWG